MNHYVYFIQAKGGGPTKIGVSNDPNRRLAELQTSHPEQLIKKRHILMPRKKDALALESMLHSIFRHERMRGEWFDLDPDTAWGQALWLAKFAAPYIEEVIQLNYEVDALKYKIRHVKSILREDA